MSSITALNTSARSVRTSSARTAVSPTAVPRSDAPRSEAPRSAAPRSDANRLGAARAEGAHTRLHITRRGRAVLTVAVLLAALSMVAAMVLSGGGAVATGSTGNVSFEHVTVSAGETLWQVAESVAPQSDPRDVISDIVSLNNLQGTDVYPGQSLAIPTKYDR